MVPLWATEVEMQASGERNGWEEIDGINTGLLSGRKTREKLETRVTWEEETAKSSRLDTLLYSRFTTVARRALAW